MKSSHILKMPLALLPPLLPAMMNYSWPDMKKLLQDQVHNISYYHSTAMY